MKLSHFSVLILFLLGTFQCTSSNKVISINTELVVVEATKTPMVMRNIPGALLKFTIISSKDIILNHIRYWEYNVPVKINKQSNDTIWAEAEFRKPNLMREQVHNEEMSAQRPIDSTCTILYTYKEESFKLVVPKLKLLTAE